MRPNAAQNRLWAALVFGSSLKNDLSEKDMMTLALAGKAVSPVTSYLAVEPGVRPSTEGLEPGALGTIGHGEGGGGSGQGIGLGSLGTLGHFDHQAYLQHELAASWSECGGGARKLELRLDTTGLEVVDVPSSVVTGAGGSTGVEQCMTEAAWSLELPASFKNKSYGTWTVKL